MSYWIVWQNASWNRLFHVRDAIALGIPVKKVQAITAIDPWFLNQITELVALEREIEKYTIEDIDAELLREAKEKGFADRQIAHLMKCLESEVFNKRHEMGIKRVFKMVDTCAAEFEAQTPYYYSAFDGENESIRTDKKKVIVLGSGPNRNRSRNRV